MQKNKWKKYYKDTYPAIWQKRALHYGFTDYHKIVLKLLGAKAGEKILDCGIGTGYPLAIHLAKKGIDITGIDIATSLLDKCYLNFKLEDLTVRCYQGDMDEGLPFIDNCFDRVYSISTTWYLLNIEKSLSEMFRVVKEGGVVLFDILNLLHISGFIHHYYSFLRNSTLIQKLKPSSHILKYRTPFRINKILKSLGPEYSIKGYFIFLLTSLPLLGNKADLSKYSKLFSYGLSNSSLRYFGSKLIYVCIKK